MKTVDPLRRLRDPLNMESYIKGMEAEIARLTNERDIAVKERSNAREQVYAANDQIDRLTAEVKKLEGAMGVYESDEVSRLRAEIERLTALLEAKTTPGYELLTDEILRIQTRCEQLEIYNVKLDAENAALKNRIAELEK